MQVELSPETLRMLEAVMANGKFASIDECVAAMAKRVQSRPVDSIEQLADEQGVSPIRDFRQLKADFWPEGESVDDFLREIRERRPADEPRVR